MAIRVILVALLIGGSAQTALADCTQLSPWPSFTRSAASAHRIIIGTVTWTPGGRVNNRFTLRVDDVLRGQAPATIEFDAFRSGAPQPICPEDSSLVVRHLGDRLALAYGAQLPGSELRITSVAFVAPSRPQHFFLPEMERLTVDQVRALAALPPTDAMMSTSTSTSGLPLELGGSLLGMVTAVAFLRRRGHQRRIAA